MRVDESHALQLAARLLGLHQEEILRVKRMGGITNENYYLATADRR